MLEIEARTPPQYRPKLLEEPRHGREAQLEMSQRDLRGLRDQRLQQDRQRSWILLREPPLHGGRQRSRPEPEVALAFRRQTLGQPLRRSLDPALLLEPPSQLLGRLAGVEVLEIGLAREQPPRLQLEQRRDQDEKLAARIEIELVPFG